MQLTGCGSLLGDALAEATDLSRGGCYDGESSCDEDGDLHAERKSWVKRETVVDGWREG